MSLRPWKAVCLACPRVSATDEGACGVEPYGTAALFYLSVDVRMDAPRQIYISHYDFSVEYNGCGSRCFFSFQWQALNRYYEVGTSRRMVFRTDGM